MLDFLKLLFWDNIVNRTAYMVVALYAGIILLCFAPYIYIAGTSNSTFTTALATYFSAEFWIFLSLFLLCHIALLLIPVKTSMKRYFMRNQFLRLRNV